MRAQIASKYMIRAHVTLSGLYLAQEKIVDQLNISSLTYKVLFSMAIRCLVFLDCLADY